MPINPPSRDTDMTIEQRLALDQARRLLQPHFAGEQVRLYVPRTAIELKLQREQRIRQSLQQQQPARVIAEREGVSRQYVSALRGRIMGGSK